MISGINHITLAVLNLDESLAFYIDVLGCKPVLKWKTGAYLLAGDLWLCLSLDMQKTKKVLLDYTHIAFSVSTDNYEKCCDNIIKSGATIWKNNTSEGASLYFLDPNGHKLEIHVSSLQARIEKIKQQPYEGTKFFYQNKK